MPDKNKPKLLDAGSVAPPRPPGRPRKQPETETDLAALGEVLRAAGPQIRAMYDAIPRQGDQTRFLRDLAAFTRAPDDPKARVGWLVWVGALRAG